MVPYTISSAPNPIHEHCFQIEASRLFNDGPHWHRHLQINFQLHPSVKLMLKYRPQDLSVLVAQWPHISKKDPTRIAYTLNHLHGETNRETVTSVGKYLARNWPHIPDHTRRDVQALFTPDKMHFVRSTPEMVQAIELGPRSCMASTSSHADHLFRRQDHDRMTDWLANNQLGEPPDWDKHPYASYSPAHGWHMAVRKAADRIDGRALCIDKFFVRSYMRPALPTDISPTDTALESWLVHQGYTKRSSWPGGSKIDPCYEGHDIDRMPYLDGTIQTITCSHNKTYQISVNGTYQCDHLDGTVERADGEDDDDDEDYGEDLTVCEACGDGYSNNDLTRTGRGDDGALVCWNCLEDSYTKVSGDQFSERYYVLDEDAAQLHNSYYIDAMHPPSNAVELFRGGWAHKDDVVTIDHDYYLEDDDDIVCLNTGVYVLRDDNVIEVGDTYYLKDDPKVVENDGIYSLRQLTLEPV